MTEEMSTTWSPQQKQWVLGGTMTPDLFVGYFEQV